MAPTNKPTETDATADQGNATAEEQPQQCPHDWKTIVDKDGKHRIEIQDSGARANVKCTRCGALAWRG